MVSTFKIWYVVLFPFGVSLKCPPNINSFSAKTGVSPMYYQCIDGDAIILRCPHGKVYFSETEKCFYGQNITSIHKKMYSSSRSDMGFREQPSLGKSYSLGTLYNARNDYVMNGFSLWKKAEIEANKDVQKQIYSETDFFTEENVFDRMSHFDIKASLKLSFLGGLIEVGGSAHYLRDGREIENSVRFNMYYDATTHSESLPVSLPTSNTYLCDEAKKPDGPTHVISSITYGMKAIFVFEKKYSSDSSKEEIGGKLSIAIKKIPMFHIEGSAEVSTAGSLNETTKDLRVKLYGDLILDSQPTSYYEAVKVYKDLPKKVKDNPSKMKYQITPISYYCDKTSVILNGISANLIDETSKILGEFLKIKQKVRTLKSSDVAGRFQKISRNLITFENELSKFENNFKSNLKVLLPKIKGSAGSELELIKIINDYIGSPFQIDKAKVFLDKRQREIKTIDLFITKTINKKHIDITDNPTANDNKCLFEKNYVMVFVLNVLPQEDVAEAYIKGTLNENNQAWYDNNIKVGEAGKIYRQFDGWALENHGPDHCFQIQLKLENDTRPFTVQIFKNGVCLTKDFVIPSHVTVPTDMAKGFDRVTLHLKPITNPFVEKVMIEYWDMLNGTKDSPLHQTYDAANILTLTGLQPKNAYGLQLRYLAATGQSKESPESFFLTTPSSPPSNFRATRVTSSTIHLKWEAPVFIAQGVIVKEYMLEVTSNGQLVKSIIANATSLFIEDLEPIKSYKIACKVKLPTEQSTIADSNVNVTINYESHTSVVNAFTSPLPPDAPTVFTSSEHTADLKWEVPTVAGGAKLTSYKVKYSRVNVNARQIRETEKVLTSFNNSCQLRDLASGTTYAVEVQVRSTVGNSEYSLATIFQTTYTRGEMPLKCQFEDSNIIKDPALHQQLIYLLKGVERTYTCWKKCYGASESEFSAPAFHTACDNRGPTVTLVSANSNVFGGFTDANWDGKLKAYRRSSESFLFSVTRNMTMMSTKQPDNAIYSASNYGPTFGSGSDLYVSHNCNALEFSYSSLGYAYQLPAGFTKGTDAANSILAGDSSFKCQDYEVYYFV